LAGILLKSSEILSISMLHVVVFLRLVPIATDGGMDLQETCSTFEIDWAALALAELDEYELAKIVCS
jgi:hypothetical protein